MYEPNRITLSLVSESKGGKLKSSSSWELSYAQFPSGEASVCPPTMQAPLRQGVFSVLHALIYPLHQVPVRHTAGMQ